MKLTFKTLQQEQFQLEVAPEDTILDVKRRINEERQIAETSQKLIYSGKILVDDRTIGSYDIKENGFVVVMPAAASTTAAPSTATSTAEAATGATALSAHSASEALVTGEHFEQAVQNMVEMGFPRDEVMRAMRASFNNPDRAVEYLMTGIPEGMDAPTSTAPHMTASVEGEEGSGGEEGGEGGNIAFLQSNPHFQRLRQAVHQNPDLLQPLLQQLAEANPRLMELIEENQQEFMHMLMGGGGGGDGDDDGGDYGEADVAGLPNVHYVNVTAEEKEAIDRLVAMGFDRAQAIEAYLACDKNEELAANFLFDNMHE
ncbi:XPC-binding domain-containing protein [Syncephalis pseudoplumigaleata]|uniref:UV excision repair protein RAD23 n=1 Tax=Syncephalis pseudoplumigaleata TaxID=1712513 RepID=A0A4P9YW37_9FUNG|nr:XPC-binding domain-containing protein [Syncephalis pseudoplumigaleata]|eukprot:RKP24303.1 XPC-binding domain-containing protein [Syncephalis pseudoplumigaleata]